MLTQTQTATVMISTRVAAFPCVVSFIYVFFFFFHDKKMSEIACGPKPDPGQLRELAACVFTLSAVFTVNTVLPKSL